MCIRDRKYTGKSEAKNEDVILQDQFSDLRTLRHEIEKNHFAKDSSCLLYTSDAADERSSVDLGGRRIIKKKKKI